MKTLPNQFRAFQDDQPEIFRAYEALGLAAAESGPLDAKTRELVKLGMAAAIKGESAVHSHTHRALELGATAEEIEHTILLGVTSLGFSTMMTALSWVRAAMNPKNQ
jgi:4-carboxymuconolactone decarboxylase